MTTIKTINSTNLRPDPHTLNSATRSYPKGTILTGDEIYTAPKDLVHNGKVYQRAGDKWLKVVSAQEPGKAEESAAGWMALVHLGSAAGLPEIIDEPPTDPPPSGEKKIVSAVITYSDGSTERLV